MRSSIEFFLSADNTNDMKEKVCAEWKRLTNNPDAELPSGTEIRMTQAKEGDLTYMVYVTIRTKLGD